MGTERTGKGKESVSVSKRTGKQEIRGSDIGDDGKVSGGGIGTRFGGSV
jgi:hypothetical protein